MNKSDLVSAIATISGANKANAARAVDAVFNAITDALSRGEDVRLVGFGSFSVVERGRAVWAGTPAPARTSIFQHRGSPSSGLGSS